MKRKRVPATMTCPCCEKRRLADEYSAPLRQERELAQRPHSLLRGEAGWSVALAQRRQLVWACDECLRHQRALPAKPWLQTYCCNPPRFAYFDRAKVCRDCGEAFVFSAREQQCWYEEYKLSVDAEAAACLRCRRARRNRVAANAEVGEALRNLDPRDAGQLVHVADLYLALGSPRKAAQYLRRAKNRLDNPAQIARLLQRIAEVEGAPAKEREALRA